VGKLTVNYQTGAQLSWGVITWGGDLRMVLIRRANAWITPEGWMRERKREKRCCKRSPGGDQQRLPGFGTVISLGERKERLGKRGVQIEGEPERKNIGRKRAGKDGTKGFEPGGG